MKQKCDPHKCIGNFECEKCPARWTPKDPDCKDSLMYNCDNYKSCDECYGNKPNTWPRKDNINILLNLSTKEKVMAFDSMVKRYVSAKNHLDMEIWIANVLSFYIKKYLK